MGSISSTTSDGEKIANPRFLKSDLPELRRSQRSPSHKKKGGRNRAKQRRKVNRLHARVANLRRVHRHKVSNDQISRYGKIAVESLNIQGMIRNHRLARAISDVTWSSFVAVLNGPVPGQARSKVCRSRVQPVDVSPVPCTGASTLILAKERSLSTPQFRQFRSLNLIDADGRGSCRRVELPTCFL